MLLARGVFRGGAILFAAAVLRVAAQCVRDVAGIGSGGTRSVKQVIREYAQRLSERATRPRVIAAGYVALVLMTAYSAILVKESRVAPALIAVKTEGFAEDDEEIAFADLGPEEFGPPVRPVKYQNQTASEPRVGQGVYSRRPESPEVRWFNGRRVRPARTVEMLVTGYSPDAASCGASADGYTATMHSVLTNGSALVAADPKVLGYGSMLSVPGYSGDLIVPVLDCGAKIKGRHIDVLFKTHQEAVRWGVKRLKVTVWEYADGRPAENVRKVR